MRAVLAVALIISLVTVVSAQEKPGVKMPTAPSTIPPDVMFALGHQGSQLTGISGRLDKIESKIEEVQKDVTRINTVGGIAALLLTVILGPIIVYQVRKRIDSGSTPRPA